MVVRDITDSQAGFKCFRREVARHIVQYQTINGWTFDVELLHIAQKCGYRIIEIPIHWQYCDKSHIRPLRDGFEMFRDLWRVRRNSAAGRYPVKRVFL